MWREGCFYWKFTVIINANDIYYKKKTDMYRNGNCPLQNTADKI